MCCNVLQCVTVWCSVLQCVAVCCSVLRQLQCLAACCSAVCYSVLQCAAVCCSVLQCVAVCCSVLQVLQRVAACCSVVQRGAFSKVCCKVVLHTAYTGNTLQHTATHCNTLQHTATAHCKVVLHTAYTGRVANMHRIPKVQVFSRKRAAKKRAPLRKMTYQDKASYGSSPRCSKYSSELTFENSHRGNRASTIFLKWQPTTQLNVLHDCRFDF